MVEAGTEEPVVVPGTAAVLEADIGEPVVAVPGTAAEANTEAVSDTLEPAVVGPGIAAEDIAGPGIVEAVGIVVGDTEAEPCTAV